MHRPPARRPRRVCLVLTAVALAGCAGDGGEIVVVDVAAQPCERPTRDLGIGVVVGPGLVVTAAHTVDGPRRELTVDGQPARVALIDHRTDLALLDADVDGAPAQLTSTNITTGTVRTTDGDLEVSVVRTGRLGVLDTTAGVRHERQVHTFSPGVAAGTSGAPLVDGAGRIAGIVVLDNSTDATAYAVTAAEVAALLARERAPAAEIGCPG